MGDSLLFVEGADNMFSFMNQHHSGRDRFFGSRVLVVLMLLNPIFCNLVAPTSAIAAPVFPAKLIGTGPTEQDAGATPDSSPESPESPLPRVEYYVPNINQNIRDSASIRGKVVGRAQAGVALRVLDTKEIKARPNDAEPSEVCI